MLEDYDRELHREAELMTLIKEKIVETPYIYNLLDFKGVCMKAIVGFVAEIGVISRFTDHKQIHKLTGYAIVSNESGK